MKITLRPSARSKDWWGAAPDTEDGDKLDILVTLVEKIRGPPLVKFR